MLNNDEKYIGRDLMKSDCEILRVKVFGDENVKGSRKAANFNAFMEPQVIVYIITQQKQINKGADS